MASVRCLSRCGQQETKLLAAPEDVWPQHNGDERGLSKVFPAPRALTRDELEALSPDTTIDRLKNCFDPWWASGQLSERQVLRSVMHGRS